MERLEGRYEYVRELGRGGAGRVVLARDLWDGDLRALKVVPAEARGTLELELDVLSRVTHRSLARVYELLRVESPTGVPFRLVRGDAVLVEEHVDGTRSDLAFAALEPEGDARTRLTLRVARETVAALAALHAAGLVHGDVSPANVLLRRTGEPLAVLIDLGLSGPPLDADGLARGTRGFLAPEAAVGVRSVSTDLFSLGATLHAWLGGVVGEPSAASLPASVPTPLAGLIEDLLAARPEERPVSAAEVAEGLARVASALGQPSRDDEPLPRAVLEPPFVGDPGQVEAAARRLDAQGVLFVGGPRQSGKSRFAREVALALQRQRRRDGLRVPTFARARASDELRLGGRSAIVHVEGVDEVAVEAVRRAESLGGRERWWIVEDAARVDVAVVPLGDVELARLAQTLGLEPEEARHRSGGLAGRLVRYAAATEGPPEEGALCPIEEQLDVAGGALPLHALGDARALVRDGRAYLRGAILYARADRRGRTPPERRALRAREVASRLHEPGPWDAHLARARGEDASALFARHAERALAGGKAEAALGLALEAEGEVRAWLGSRALARLARYDDAFRLAEELPGPEAAAWRAELARRAGKLERAAVELAQADGAGADTRGWLALGRGDLSAARENAEAADLRAWIELSAGRLDAASTIVEEVLARSEPRSAEARERRARVAVAAGAIAQTRGDLDRAARHHSEAFGLARELGDAHLAATAAANEGIVALDAGRLGAGRRALREAARRYATIGRARDLGRALCNLASVALWVGDDEEAAWYAERARTVSTEAGDALGQAYVACIELELALRRGLVEASVARARDVAMGDARVRCRAAALLAPHRPDEARALFAEDAPAFDRGYARARLAMVERREVGVLPDARTFEEELLVSRLALDVALERGEGVPAARARLRGLLDRTSRELEADQRRALRRHPGFASAWAARPERGGQSDDVGRWRALARLGARLHRSPERVWLAEGLELARDALDAERAFWMERSEQGELEVREVRAVGEVIDARPSRSVVARALSTGALVTTVDALGDEEWGNAQSVAALALRSVACVALSATGLALYVDDRVRPAAFSAADLELLRALGEVLDAGIAAARAREAERRARERDASLRQELEARLERASEELAARRRADARFGLVARSAAMGRFVELLARVAPTDSTVLLRGETGTGKERVARAIHDASGRARGPFVAESCAALPEGLLESALFGHVRGAFSGASDRRRGLFELAHGGTLLLDEIGETSPAMQAKLLRALQEGEVRALGSERTVRVDVRVIAATHRDLRQLVREGRFREDLFYRLAVLELEVPPLRERREDLPDLVASLLAHRGTNVRVSVAAVEWLASRAWPGNVRELDAALERALLTGAEVLLPEHFSGSAVDADPDDGRELRERVDELERRLLVDALEVTGGNRTHAAARLGLSRVGLRKKMKRLGIP